MRDRIGSYRIERVLGDGGMGIVYKGCHEVLGRDAAIKTVLPRHVSNAHLRKRLLAEAKAQARLLHPNIVALYEPIEDHGELFIAMEYVDGATLDQRLKQCPGSRMSLDEALPLFEQLLDALAFVHSESVVHRDVKPSNVMVSRTGCVKLTDFGLALLAGEPRLTATLGIPGTPQYMSPEQLQGKDVDHRSDIYSAALVLYRVLSGRPAFESKEYLAQIHERMIGPPDLQTLMPDLPPSVCEAIAFALRVEPAERFQSAFEFRDELRRAAIGFFPSRSVSPNDEATIPIAAAAEPLSPIPDSQPHTLSKVAAWVVVAGSVTAAASMLVNYLDRPSAALVTSQAQTIAAEPAPPITDTHAIESQPPAKPQRPNLTLPHKPAPNLDPAQKADDAAALAAVLRKRELEALREEIRRGLISTETRLDSEDFTAAAEELDRLDRMAAREPAELWQERNDIARLRNRVIEKRAEATARKQQDALWQSRLGDIEKAIASGEFPEAQRIAKNVKDDPQTPPAVAARAAELLQEAKRKLVETFQNGTAVSPTTNTIRKPSSPPRKNE